MVLVGILLGAVGDLVTAVVRLVGAPVVIFTVGTLVVSIVGALVDVPVRDLDSEPRKLL